MPDNEKVYITKTEFYTACFVGLCLVDLLTLRQPSQDLNPVLWVVLALQFYCIFKLRQSRLLKENGCR